MLIKLKIARRQWLDSMIYKILHICVLILCTLLVFGCGGKSGEEEFSPDYNGNFNLNTIRIRRIFFPEMWRSARHLLGEPCVPPYIKQTTNLYMILCITLMDCQSLIEYIIFFIVLIYDYTLCFYRLKSQV